MAGPITPGLEFAPPVAPTRHDPPPPVRAPDRVVPVTREQRHIWLDMVRGNESLAYNEPMVLRFRRASDTATIAEALRLLVRRHEALRAHFAHLDEAPVQIIAEDVDILLPTVDLGDVPAERQDEAVEAMAAADAAIAFDLERGPLLRARIIRLGEADHRVALTLHHILFDGRSLMHALTIDLPAIFEALSEGRAPILPPVAQYGDYAVQQRDAPLPDWSQDLAYWRARLAGGADRIALPVDTHAVRDTEDAVGTERAVIDAKLTDGLRALAHEHRTSLYAVTLAVLMAQLGRYGGDDITIGSVTDTRSTKRLEAMVGYCLQTVALRTRPVAERPFDEFLDEVNETLFGAYEHSGVPFERVARMLDGGVPGAKGGRFQLLFTMLPKQASDETLLSVHHRPPPRPKADLYVIIEETNGGLETRFHYDPSLFRPDTVRRIAAHWVTLHTSVVAAPATPLGDLAMMPQEERAAIAALGRGPRRDRPAATLHALIDRAIARHPDAVAVTATGVRWRYAELGARADAIAGDLAVAGIGKGALVALCVERSPMMVAAILGILKSGAAYVPLDPSFPPARLAAILSDANPALLISEAATAPLFEGWTGRALRLDHRVAAAPAVPTAATAGSPDDLAYVIYTSGSTGVPKGVEIEHRGVVNVVEAMRHRPGFECGETMLALSRLTFDMSVPDIFLPLVAGGTIAIAPSEAITDPHRLAAEIEASGCTLIQATPATWQSLITDGWAGKPGLKILCGGEALGRTLADDLLARGMRLWNGYGPTETTIYTTMEEVRADRAISIGTPIDNVEVMILDARGQDVPCNVAGHLHIAGSGLARRYRDPALTARAFVVRDGRRLYRSGDVALRRDDGRIEWLGRNDGQIKIRGFRIDVGDVEAAICGCPGVALAAVAAVAGHAGARSDLAAYVVLRPHAKTLDFGALRQQLATRLPGYMIPTRYMLLDAMPLTSSGKIRRDALPALTAEPRGEAIPIDLPRGTLENRVADIWRDVLNLEHVGATDDFFDLGGHSLLAAKLVGRLSAEFHRRLPLATLLRAPTIRQLARILETEQAPIDLFRTIRIGRAAGRPLFWIDATPHFRANGFRDLAAALDGQLSLVGLPVDTEGFARMADESAVATIADAMAAAVLAYAMDGDCLIGGWCNGGLLALAVADRLRARGRTVAAIFMLDTTNQALYRRKMTRVRREVAQAFRARPDERGAYLKDLLGGYGSRMRRRFSTATDGVTTHLNLTDRFFRIIRNTDFPAYDGRVVLLEAESGSRSGLAQWRDLLTGQVDRVQIAGGHESILHPPFVEGLARQMLAHLAGEPGTLGMPDIRHPARLRAHSGLAPSADRAER